MIRSRSVVALLAAVAVALSLTACKSSGKQTLRLNGAGSTFANPLYSSWGSKYTRLHPDTQINYQSIGSGGGIRQLIAGTVDFGGTDVPMSDEELASARQNLGSDVLHFPVALGGCVPIYNLPGVTTPLNFTAEDLAGIFLGKITKWNDPAITKVNPGVNLPASTIVVVHRSDSGGTTFVWTDYLGKVSADWKKSVGVNAAVSWPLGIGGKGNEGVAGLVKQSPNSIGYAELIYAVQNKLTYGQVQNSAGKFVKADLESLTAAAAGAVKDMPADFRVSITNPPGDGAYPISSFTWMLVPRDVKDKAKGAALKSFLLWGLTDGQKQAQTLTYAPIAQSVIDQEMKTIQTLNY